MENDLLSRKTGIYREDTQFRRMLTDAFELEMEANITDEMIARILAPVIRMIDEGRFRIQPRKSFFRLVLPQMTAVAAVVVMITTTSFFVADGLTDIRSHDTVTIIEQNAPLVAAPVYGTPFRRRLLPGQSRQICTEIRRPCGMCRSRPC